MNLLVTINENYIYLFKIMLHSFFLNNPDERKVCVYLLHSEISGEKLNELELYCARYGARFVPIMVDSRLFDNAPTNKRYPKEMYYRLFAPLILPKDVERILYLDPDILIINPVKKLWETDLGGCVFAAASHAGLTEITTGINFARLNIDHEYYNTGVLLIDLNRARKITRAEDIFRCVNEYEKNLFLPDQDVFNVLYGKYTLPLEEVIWNYDVRNYSKHKLKSAGKYDSFWVMKNTAILHFCGKKKPWRKNYKNAFGFLYKHYMNLAEKAHDIVMEEYI